MPESQDQYLHLSTVANVKAGGTDSNTTLKKVNINKGTATAVVTVYDGQSTAGAVVAVIDAATKSLHDFNVRCKNGIFVDQTVAAADVTVSYT